MSHYIEQQDLESLIPAGWLVQALDDDGDGEQDELTFDQVREAAEDAVNAELSTSMSVPVESPENYPFLEHVTRYEAARVCYARRGYDTSDPKGFPHFLVWEMAWKKLGKIGAGDLPLGPVTAGTTNRSTPRGEVITGRASTHSSSGRFAQ